MPYNTLKLQVTGDIATITLSRPEKRNAISTEMIDELMGALAEVEAGAARVAILTGEGRAFCSGIDLGALRAIATQSAEENLEDARRFARLLRRIWSFPKPTIAAVNGAAIAGGCGIATVCDFTLAVPEATFGYPEVRIGFLPANVTVFLMRQVAEKHARDLLLTGRIIDSAEAQRIGLITRIASAEELISAAQTLAATLVASSPTSLLKTKHLLCDMFAPEIYRALELAIAESVQIRSTADFREGLASFLEKRAPKWSGQ